MTTRILFIERKPSLFVSIEKVFRSIASSLPRQRFTYAFQQASYGNDLISVCKNLLLFKKELADIYHVTGHTHYLALLLPVERTVLTIHDLGFLHTRRGIRRYILKKLLLDWPVKRLRYITAVSEATKSEIIQNLPSAASKIRVIANPVGDQYVNNAPKEFNAAYPVILQLGTMDNKNVPNLIRSVDGINCRLRIIGPLSDKIKKALELSNIDVENIEKLGDDEIIEAYRNADIIAFCSTFEGFGLPIIEGQAMQRPVVTSNLSPMLEVAGYAAEFVDPHDTASIRSGIRRVIEDPENRARLIELGVKNAKRFDAKTIAACYADLYDEVITAI